MYSLINRIDLSFISKVWNAMFETLFTLSYQAKLGLDGMMRFPKAFYLQAEPTSPPNSTPTESTDENLFDVNEQLGHIDDWLPDWLAPYWHTLDDYPFIGALIIVALGYLIARVLVHFLRVLVLSLIHI